MTRLRNKTNIPAYDFRLIETQRGDIEGAIEKDYHPITILHLFKLTLRVQVEKKKYKWQMSALEFLMVANEYDLMNYQIFVQGLKATANQRYTLIFQKVNMILTDSRIPSSAANTYSQLDEWGSTKEEMYQALGKLKSYMFRMSLKCNVNFITGTCNKGHQTNETMQKDLVLPQQEPFYKKEIEGRKDLRDLVYPDEIHQINYLSFSKFPKLHNRWKQIQNLEETIANSFAGKNSKHDQFRRVVQNQTQSKNEGILTSMITLNKLNVNQNENKKHQNQQRGQNNNNDDTDSDDLIQSQDESKDESSDNDNDRPPLKSGKCPGFFEEKRKRKMQPQQFENDPDVNYYMQEFEPHAAQHQDAFGVIEEHTQVQQLDDDYIQNVTAAQVCDNISPNQGNYHIGQQTNYQKKFRQDTINQDIDWPKEQQNLKIQIDNYLKLFKDKLYKDGYSKGWVMQTLVKGSDVAFNRKLNYQEISLEDALKETQVIPPKIAKKGRGSKAKLKDGQDQKDALADQNIQDENVQQPLEQQEPPDQQQPENLHAGGKPFRIKVRPADLQLPIKPYSAQKTSTRISKKGFDHFIISLQYVQAPNPSFSDTQYLYLQLAFLHMKDANESIEKITDPQFIKYFNGSPFFVCDNYRLMNCPYRHCTSFNSNIVYNFQRRIFSEAFNERMIFKPEIQANPDHDSYLDEFMGVANIVNDGYVYIERRSFCQLICGLFHSNFGHMFNPFILSPENFPFAEILSKLTFNHHLQNFKVVLLYELNYENCDLRRVPSLYQLNDSMPELFLDNMQNQDSLIVEFCYFTQSNTPKPCSRFVVLRQDKNYNLTAMSMHYGVNTNIHTTKGDAKTPKQKIQSLIQELFNHESFDFQMKLVYRIRFYSVKLQFEPEMTAFAKPADTLFKVRDLAVRFFSMYSKSDFAYCSIDLARNIEDIKLMCDKVQYEAATPFYKEFENEQVPAGHYASMEYKKEYSYEDLEIIEKVFSQRSSFDDGIEGFMMNVENLQLDFGSEYYDPQMIFESLIRSTDIARQINKWAHSQGGIRKDQQQRAQAIMKFIDQFIRRVCYKRQTFGHLFNKLKEYAKKSSQFVYLPNSKLPYQLPADLIYVGNHYIQSNKWKINRGYIPVPCQYVRGRRFMDDHNNKYSFMYQNFSIKDLSSQDSIETQHIKQTYKNYCFKYINVHAELLDEGFNINAQVKNTKEAKSHVLFQYNLNQQQMEQSYNELHIINLQLSFYNNMLGDAVKGQQQRKIIVESDPFGFQSLEMQQNQNPLPIKSAFLPIKPQMLNSNYNVNQYTGHNKNNMLMKQEYCYDNQQQNQKKNDIPSIGYDYSRNYQSNSSNQQQFNPQLTSFNNQNTQQQQLNQRSTYGQNQQQNQQFMTQFDRKDILGNPFSMNKNAKYFNESMQQRISQDKTQQNQGNLNLMSGIYQPSNFNNQRIQTQQNSQDSLKNRMITANMYGQDENDNNLDQVNQQNLNIELIKRKQTDGTVETEDQIKSQAFQQNNQFAPVQHKDVLNSLIPPANNYNQKDLINPFKQVNSTKHTDQTWTDNQATSSIEKIMPPQKLSQGSQTQFSNQPQNSAGQNPQQSSQNRPVYNPRYDQIMKEQMQYNNTIHAKYRGLQQKVVFAGNKYEGAGGLVKEQQPQSQNSQQNQMSQFKNPATSKDIAQGIENPDIKTAKTITNNTTKGNQASAQKSNAQKLSLNVKGNQTKHQNQGKRGKKQKSKSSTRQNKQFDDVEMGSDIPEN